MQRLRNSKGSPRHFRSSALLLTHWERSSKSSWRRCARAAYVVSCVYIDPRSLGMETSMSDDRIKELFKAAILEVLQEHRDLLRDALAEAIEDLALARAIEDGEGTETVTRDEV